MSLTDQDSGAEYGRPPVYSRPPNASMVKAVERVLKGQTQTDALKDNGNG